MVSREGAFHSRLIRLKSLAESVLSYSRKERIPIFPGRILLYISLRYRRIVDVNRSRMTFKETQA
jgi:hypothetical protein